MKAGGETPFWSRAWGWSWPTLCLSYFVVERTQHGPSGMEGLSLVHGYMGMMRKRGDPQAGVVAGWARELPL